MHRTVKRIATVAAAVCLVAGSTLAASAAFSSRVNGSTVEVTTGTVVVETSANTAIGEAGNTDDNSNSSRNTLYVQHYRNTGSLAADWTLDMTLDIDPELVPFTSFDIIASANDNASCVQSGNVFAYPNRPNANRILRAQLSAADLLADGFSTDTTPPEGTEGVCVGIRTIIDDADDTAQDKAFSITQGVTLNERL